ncbi:MAG: hypothetical protein AABZ31_08190, partial [Bdellovibrionota bacterium]
MKNIKFTVLFVLTMAFANFALAAEEFGPNEMTASQYAKWVAEIKAPEDVLKALPMSEKDENLVSEDLRNNPMKSFMPPIVSMNQPTKFTIKMGKDQIQISFRQLDKGNLYINDVGLKLDSKKTYFNYKAEIEEILRKTTKSAFFKIEFISSAYAQKPVLREVVAISAALASSNEYLFRDQGSFGLQK